MKKKKNWRHTQEEFNLQLCHLGIDSRIGRIKTDEIFRGCTSISSPLYQQKVCTQFHRFVSHFSFRGNCNGPLPHDRPWPWTHRLAEMWKGEKFPGGAGLSWLHAFVGSQSCISQRCAPCNPRNGQSQNHTVISQNVRILSVRYSLVNLLPSWARFIIVIIIIIWCYRRHHASTMLHVWTATGWKNFELVCHSHRARTSESS